MRSTFRTSTSVFPIVAVALAMTLAGPAPMAHAQDAADGGEGDVVIVTGTRRQGRTISNSPVPIDVIGADALTERTIARIQREGVCFVGGAHWRGRQIVRISITGEATTEADIDVSADAILGAWRAECGANA